MRSTCLSFFFNDTATTEIYTLSLHDALPILIPVNIRFIAKHVLKRIPFLGWYMAGTGMIFLNRSNRRESMRSLKLAGERIRAGSNILAFPEGTRSKDGRILPFKKGSFVLDRKSTRLNSSHANNSYAVF